MIKIEVKTMDFIVSLFFILIMIIFSGVFRTLISKSVKKKFDQSTVNDNDDRLTINDNTSYDKEVIREEEKKPDILDLFEEYSLKKKNEVYNKDTYLNRNIISLNDKGEIEVKKEKEEIIHKRKMIQKEKLQSRKNEMRASLMDKIGEDHIALAIDKEPALKRIKKLSYFKQAVILSEILGPPKSFDL